MLINELESISYRLLVRGKQDTNKGDFGSIAILGGSFGMHGALYLAGRSAMLMGAGKVTLGSLDENFTIDYMYPELITTSAKCVMNTLDNYNVIAIGPGLGCNDAAHDLLTYLIRKATLRKLIFDADALNLIAASVDLQNKFKNLTDKIITPHPGEAARLLAVTTEVIQADRLTAINMLWDKFQAVSLLKGSGSLIQSSTTVYQNNNGNPALSNAGQGDTLTGMIAGFAGQGLNLLAALRFAVYLHGRAADELAKEVGKNGILASQVALHAHKLLNQILYA